MTAPAVAAPWRAAHVVALSGLAVTAPLLDVLGANPTFFVAHDATPGQVLLVAALATLVVPTVLPPNASGHPDSLFTLLADEYEITAHEQLTELCTPDLCEDAAGPEQAAGLGTLLSDAAVIGGRVVLPASLEGWLPRVDDTWANFGLDPVALDQEADRVTDDRQDLVDEMGEADRLGDLRGAIADLPAGRGPRLTVVHALLPHVPWTCLPDGSSYPDPGNPGLDDNVWTTTGPRSPSTPTAACPRRPA